MNIYLIEEFGEVLGLAGYITGMAIVFLFILWIGKKVSRFAALKLSLLPMLERAKVEGIFDFSMLIYRILLLTTWYLALRFIGIDLTFLVEFVLTNVTIIFTVAVASFGLAWALSTRSQTQAHKLVKSFLKKMKEIFVGYGL